MRICPIPMLKSQSGAVSRADLVFVLADLDLGLSSTSETECRAGERRRGGGDASGTRKRRGVRGRRETREAGRQREVVALSAKRTHTPTIYTLAHKSMASRKGGQRPQLMARETSRRNMIRWREQATRAQTRCQSGEPRSGICASAGRGRIVRSRRRRQRRPSL